MYDTIVRMENDKNYYGNQHYNEALHQMNSNYTIPSTNTPQYHQHQNTSEHDISHYRVASRYEKECEILKDLKAIKIIINRDGRAIAKMISKQPVSKISIFPKLNKIYFLKHYFF